MQNYKNNLYRNIKSGIFFFCIAKLALAHAVVDVAVRLSSYWICDYYCSVAISISVWKPAAKIDNKKVDVRIWYNTKK
jgi:hypothetical protein